MSSYTNWGPKAIDIGGYRQFLTDNNVDKEVVVVVLDTGINTSHSMFSNRLLRDDNGKIVGYSYHNSTYQYSYNNLSFEVGDSSKYSFEDDHSHGTHVAGIICDLTPSNVKILPIKIGGETGHSHTTTMIAAYIRIIEVYSTRYNIVATNLSYSGGGKTNESEKDTFNSQCYQPLIDKNILSVTAAGNEYEENNIEGLKAIVVSSLKQQGSQYVLDNTYSNYGKFVDISAPGTQILSAGISASDSAGSPNVYKSGTSMASPQVAGVVALLCLNPNLPVNFTASNMEQMLYNISLDIGATGKDIYYGHGMLNLKYFETEQVEQTLSFYRDGILVDEYQDNTRFEQGFNLEIRCSDPDYNIIYSTNRTIPTINNSITYSSEINVSDAIYIYAMGVKVNNGEIIGRTNLYNISYFNISAPIEQYFEIEDGTLISYTGSYEYLTIPSEVNGETVYGIGPSLFKHSNLKSITLPDTITSISGYAFQYCNDLEYIYAPNVSKIYIAAFSYCESLTKIYDCHPSPTDSVGAFFPNLTTTVGFTFSSCTNLESVSLSELKDIGNSGGYDFQACSNLKSVNLPAINSIPDGTFYLCESLTGTFYIGEFVNSIGLSAFGFCKITSFVIDENNNNFYTDGIGIYSANSLVAFACGNENINYSILDSVNINKETTTITAISESVMAKSKINILTIPPSITTINKFAFSDSQINILNYNADNCSSEGYYNGGIYQPWGNINVVEIGANVQTVPAHLFSRSFIKEVIIIKSIDTAFGVSCFYIDLTCTNITLVLDFDNITLNYITGFISTSKLFINRNVEYIYTKSEIPASTNIYLKDFKHFVYDGEYYIYSKQELVNKYTIISSSNGNGQINPAGTNYYNEGATCVYTFEPNYGYKIGSIIIDGITLSADDINNAKVNGYTFSNISSNHTIVVTFVACEYTITVISPQNGIISPSNSISVLHGQNKKFTFTPNTGYHLASVTIDGIDLPSGDISNIAVNGYTFINVTQEHTISATFEKNIYTITANAGSNGTISPSGNIQVTYGDNKTFVFDASTGYTVEAVYVDGQNIGKVSSYTFDNINANHTINVSFTLKVYTITATAGEGGRISPQGVTSVQHGGKQSYSFIPNTGYKVKEIKVNNLYAGVIDGYTFNNVTSNQTITVEFEKIKLTITVICGEHGSVSPSENVSVEYGGSKTFAIIPDKNYGISYIELNGKLITPQNTITINDVITNQTLKVVFTQEFLITSSSDENGTITQSSSVLFGNQKRFDFYPNEGYKVKDVKVDGISIGALNYYVFLSVDSSHTISVEYEIKRFNIKLYIDGHGSANPNESLENIAYGEDRVFTVFAESDWNLFKVYVNGKNIDVTDNRLEISNITEDLNIQVIFKQNEKAPAFVLGIGNISVVGAMVIVVTILTILLIKSRKKLNTMLLQESEQGALSQYEDDNQDNIIQSQQALERSKNKEVHNNYQQNQTAQKRYAPVNPTTNQYATPKRVIKHETTLQKAINLSKQDYDNFVSFCNRYKIDYKRDYDNAAMRFYQAYLRSLNK